MVIFRLIDICSLDISWIGRTNARKSIMQLAIELPRKQRVLSRQCVVGSA